jgi:hypothetical protein
MRYNFALATFYFCTVVLVTNIILLNLFLAILLSNFNAPLETADDQDLDLAGM